MLGRNVIDRDEENKVNCDRGNKVTMATNTAIVAAQAVMSIMRLTNSRCYVQIIIEIQNHIYLVVIKVKESGLIVHVLKESKKSTMEQGEEIASELLVGCLRNA